MRSQSTSQVELLRFSNLSSITGVEHFITTRAGGVSEGPFASLNLSLTTGDPVEHVRENQLRLAAKLGIDREALIFPAKQLHGAQIWEVTSTDEPHHEVDVLVTRLTRVAIAVLSADCVPILLCDPKRRVVAAVHSGRRGFLAGAVPAAIAFLHDKHGTDPIDLIAGVGPAIAAKDYSLAPVDVELIQKTFGKETNLLTPVPDKKGWTHFDLWGAALVQLKAAGVPESSIEVMRRNTFDQPEHFYSARRQKPFGCFATGIMLT